MTWMDLLRRDFSKWQTSAHSSPAPAAVAAVGFTAPGKCLRYLPARGCKCRRWFAGWGCWQRPASCKAPAPGVRSTSV